MKYLLKITLVTLLILLTLSAHSGFNELGQKLFAYIDDLEKTPISTIREFLRQNPDLINQTIENKHDNNNKITPLIYAIKYAQKKELIEMLIGEFNADINQALPDGRTPLYVALDEIGCVEMSDFLQKNGAFTSNVLFFTLEQLDKQLKELKRQETVEMDSLSSIEKYLAVRFSDTQYEKWREKNRERPLPKRRNARKKLKQKADSETPKPQETEDELKPKPSQQDDMHQYIEDLQRELSVVLEERAKLKDEKADNNDQTDYYSTTCFDTGFGPWIQEKTKDQQLQVIQTPFIQKLSREATPDKDFIETLEKYMIMSFFIYDMLDEKSKTPGINKDIKLFIDKAVNATPWLDAYYALKKTKDGTVSKLTKEEFKIQETGDFLTRHKKLGEYLESTSNSSDDSIASLPQDLKIIAHAFVWMGGCISHNRTLVFWLEVRGIYSEIFDSDYQQESLLYLSLVDALAAVINQYPGYVDDFLGLVRQIYDKKIELLTEITP